MSGGFANHRASVGESAFSSKGWWLFCLVILILKFSLLALDHVPIFFFGDSASYIWTALSGWIPPDRSFFYGYVIRWSSLAAGTLFPLLAIQTVLGAATAILVALICHRMINLPSPVSFLFGFLSACDPLQLVWERYVMTEVISLFLYLLALYLSFSYVKQRRLWQLAIIQVIWVLIIGFRISYLLVFQTGVVLLPLTAFFPELWEAIRGASSTVRAAVTKPLLLHFTVSIALALSLQAGYKELNGRLSHRQPAFLYASGLNLIAMWAPALQPSDSPDPRLSALIADGDQFSLRSLNARGLQRYRKGYLVARWQNAEPTLSVADRVADETAMHALARQPLAMLSLGWQTFLEYWHYRHLHNQARYELGPSRLPPQFVSELRDSFHFAPVEDRNQLDTLLQRYFLVAQPYYYIALMTPFLCAGLFFVSRQRYIFLLFLHSSILLGTSVLFTVTATVRYLQPLSLLLILTAALAVEWRYRRKRD